MYIMLIVWVIITCIICFNVPKFRILPTECIFVFRINHAINNSYFPKQLSPVDLRSGDVIYFL
jgi:hypothetical protein